MGTYDAAHQIKIPRCVFYPRILGKTLLKTDRTVESNTYAVWNPAAVRPGPARGVLFPEAGTAKQKHRQRRFLFYFSLSSQGTGAAVHTKASPLTNATKCSVFFPKVGNAGSGVFITLPAGKRPEPTEQDPSRRHSGAHRQTRRHRPRLRRRPMCRHQATSGVSSSGGGKETARPVAVLAQVSAGRGSPGASGLLPLESVAPFPPA